MGGAIGQKFTEAPMSRLLGEESRIGNVTPWAEFNIYCDPEAAESIFSNPILASKTTLISLDLTHQVLAAPAVQARILTKDDDLSSPPSILRRILHALLNFFAETYKTVFGLDSGPPLHDPLAVAVILSNLNSPFANASPKEALKFDDRGGERFSVTVITNGQHGKDVSVTGQLGRTTTRPVEGRGVTIPRGVDVDAFWDLAVHCIELADECCARRR
jgi:uridine nucleosidase